jgi:cyclase
MLMPRIMPCLLLKGRGLVKGEKFKAHKYVGDPINAVRIFNDKEVDELLFLDITATQEKRIPPLDLIQTIADQCLMPFGVGGGIRTVDDAREILARGAEKVCLNTAAVETPSVVSEIANRFGSQSVIVSIDVKLSLLNKYRVRTHCSRKKTHLHPVEFAQLMEKHGAGEILLNDIDRDGTMLGYNIPLIKEVASAVSVPVIVCGGAGKYCDLAAPITHAGASAVAAGSLFVFHGRRKAVLLNYPSMIEKDALLKNSSFGEVQTSDE